MSTRIREKFPRKFAYFVHENSPFMSTRILPPRTLNVCNVRSIQPPFVRSKKPLPMFFVSTFKNSRLSHTWEWEKLQRYFKVSYQILWMKKLIICKMSDKKLSLGLFLLALILKNGCSFLGGDGMEVEGLTVWVTKTVFFSDFRIYFQANLLNRF